MAMTLADYAALYDAIVHMSCDVESECPRYMDVINPEEWDDECAAKYALIQAMVECINDVPARFVESAIKKGLKLPEVDIVFTDAPHTTIDGEIID